MLFNSFHFLVFFPIVVLIYFIIPKKVRYVWLLITSYYFYMCWDAKYALLIAASTVVTYLSGIAIDRVKSKEQGHYIKFPSRKLILWMCCLFNLSILFFFKYFSWIFDNIKTALGQSVELPWSIVLPVGISFYTFQALGYTIDVYRGEIRAEKNLLKYALFVSFFPQLVAGPIERSKNLLEQLYCQKDFNYENVKNGLLLMLWGFFEKIVIADKAAILVDYVYNNYQTQEGAVILVATIFFAFQIYCDFGGYTHIAIGAAKVMNIDLMNNFAQPYFALNIKEFWRRWHISLSSWFKDYLYIPFGGNRCSRGRKYFNLFVTFLLSGLWHGASWHYVVWGALHGIYQIVSDVTGNIRKKVMSILRIQTDCFSYRLFQRMFTFFMVSLIWIFFRAETLTDAMGMFQKIIFNLNPSVLLGDIWSNLGLNALQLEYLLFAILILILVDWLHEKEKSIRSFLSKQNLVFRWMIYYIGVIFIILSLIQTFGQSANVFIYFQF